MADNEVVIRSGKTLRLSDATLVIKDEGARIDFVDLLTEIRHAKDGSLYLSLASGVWDNGNDPEAVVVARLRMTVTFAQALNQALANEIKAALQPVDDAQKN